MLLGTAVIPFAGLGSRTSALLLGFCTVLILVLLFTLGAGGFSTLSLRWRSGRGFLFHRGSRFFRIGKVSVKTIHLMVLGDGFKHHI